MRRSVVLIVSAEPQRRLHWSALVQSAGHWPLVAATLDQAVVYIRKVRPSLVLTDAQVGPDRGLWLLDDLRAISPLQDVPVVVVGELALSEVQSHDPAVSVWSGGGDAAMLMRLLDLILQ